MNKKEFKQIMEDTFVELHKLTDTKGVEYAGDQDQLANFKEQGEMLGLPPVRVLGIYLNKHLGSINRYIRNSGGSLSEPINERIDDAILYLILLKALINER